MNRDEQLKQLVGGIQADLADCRRLSALLEQQWHFVLLHDVQRLEQVRTAILSLTEQLERHREVRVKQVVNLLGIAEGGAMSKVWALLPNNARVLCERLWTQLTDEVAHCKRLNTRNGQLMVMQQELIERILFGESNVYVPF